MSAPANDRSLNLKHRLTGAVILIALAVAATSMLLDRDDEWRDAPSAAPAPASNGQSFISRIVSAEKRSGEVPAPESLPSPAIRPEGQSEGTRSVAVGAPRPEPRVQPVLIPDHRLPRPVPRINTVESEPKSARAEPAPSVGALSAAPAGGEWVVQVGVFAESTNAERVARRLEKGGFRPSSEPIEVGGKAMTRVWVGPFADRKEATRAKNDISRGFDLNGFVAHQP